MIRDAFAALEALSHGESADHPVVKRWMNALIDVRWAVMTPNGVTLTAEGRSAHQQMAHRLGRLPGEK
jgi:hypothetical protein